MRMLLAVWLIACLACDQAPMVVDEPTPTGPSDSLTYLALGDSYTIGESVPDSQRWPVQLANRLTKFDTPVLEPRIIARTGWTTGDLLAGIDAATNLDSSYDMVSLLIGVNNQYRGYDISIYTTQLPQLLDKAIALAGGRRDHVFMLSIPDYGLTPFGQNANPQKIARELDRYNALADSMCQAYQVAFYDITEVSREFGLDPEYVANDNLHPSSKMYTAWVNEVYQEVKALVEE